MKLELVVAVDLVSALAMLVVAAFFLVLWRQSRAPLHLLFGLAFATLALGISTVSTSEFDLTGQNTAVDAARILAHTSAPLMLVLGYWASWRGRGTTASATGGVAFLVAGALALLLYSAPPAGSISAGSARNAFIVAHTLQFLLYLALVVLSARNFLRAPTVRRALVPLAFLAYSFSKYSWLLIDLSGDSRLVPFIYFWRFAMLGLMLAALLAPFVRGVPDAEA